MDRKLETDNELRNVQNIVLDIVLVIGMYFLHVWDNETKLSDTKAMVIFDFHWF